MTSRLGRPTSAFSASGRALGDDPALVDDADAVGEDVGLLEVLRGQHHGDAVLARQARDLFPEVGAALGIEAGRGLVEEEDAGRVHERKREVEAALHAAGVAAHLAVRGVGQADALEQLGAAADALALGQAVQRGLEAQVLATRQQRVERGLLEGGADRLAHVRAVADDVVAGNARGARGGRQQRGEHEHGGRLAGAVRAQEAIDLARLDAEVDPVHRADAALELADETVDLDAVV